MTAVTNRGSALFCEGESMDVQRVASVLACLLEKRFEQARLWMPAHWMVHPDKVEAFEVRADEPLTDLFGRLVELSRK